MKTHYYLSYNKPYTVLKFIELFHPRMRRQMQKWLKSYWSFCAEEMLRQWSTSSPHSRPLVNSMLHR